MTLPSLSHTLRRLGGAFLAFLACSLVFAATPVWAASIHAYKSSFGAASSSPANPYPLSDPTDVAVDNSAGPTAHDVYVADSANHRVEKFTPSGEFVLMFGKDVNQTTGADLCTAISGNSCKVGTSGASPGAFQTPTFLAVDNTSGDLYVGDTGDGTVAKFDSSGNLIASWATGGQLTGFSPLDGIAVDPGGNLVVLGANAHWYEPDGVLHSEFSVPRESSPLGLAVDSKDILYKIDGSLEVTTFSNAGAVLALSLESGPAAGLTVDPSSDDLYVDDASGSLIDRFAPGCGQHCTPLETFGSGHLSEARGLSVDQASGDVYVANAGAGDVVDLPQVVVPAIAAESASNIVSGKSPSATLAAQVVPDGGEVTACYFEIRGEQRYEIEPGYAGGGWFADNHDERSIPCTPGLPYSGPTDVTAAASGLYLGTTYEYRLVASNSSGTVYGQFQKFRVPGLPIADFLPVPSTTQAGGHPDIRTRFDYASREAQEFPTFPTECLCQDARTITNHLPAGVIGNPHAVPYCSPAQFGTFTCPPDSQVGTIWTLFRSADFFSPLYNIEPDPDQAGLLGFEFPFTSSPAFIELSARTGSDYGLDATLANVPQTVPPEGTVVTLWGVPADPSHDAYRVAFGTTCTNTVEEPPSEVGTRPPCNGPPTSSTSPRIPFLENPTTCGESLTAELGILAYDTGTSFAESPYPATTGCDQLSFNPSLSAQPTTTATDTPSGLEVNLSVPQQQSPAAPSPSEIRAASVKLPQGFSINPGAADGKSACADAEARLGTPQEAQCPETSKIGTLVLNSSALPGPIPGYVYLLQPKPADRYRILLSANGFATHVKLLGSVTPDPATGQLTTSFPSLPQSPFTDFDIHLFGSERGLLATPTRCGQYPVQSTFTPWDPALPEQTSTQFFNVTSGPGGSSCPGLTRPFNPGLQASSLDSTAGAHSPFSLELTRPDGDQNLSSLTVKTPPGFLATLKGISYCPDTALAAAAQPGYSGLREQAGPSCPAASQIGESLAGAGAGDHPLYLPGKVYLAGPYKGAPLSLAVITPAVSGPYDLGNVVVRAALHVNPETAQITAVSDPLPQILEGIPLRLRQVRIDLNRPGFTLNPTNCDPFSVNGEIFGSEGALASPSAHFQVANCRVLSFAPKLALRFSGSTKRAGNPALKATVTYPAPAPYANIASTTVALPPAEQIDNAHIRDPCTKVQFNLGAKLGEKCPAGSVIGFARADTPLLPGPLEGPVYFRSAPENKSGLPDIVAVLRGQIEITLDGKIKTIFQKVDGERVPRIRTTFATVPDAPVSKFTLSLDGANKGLLQNSANLCSTPQRIGVKMVGQNGKTLEENPLLTTPCGKQAKKKRKADNGRRAGR